MRGTARGEHHAGAKALIAPSSPGSLPCMEHLEVYGYQCPGVNFKIVGDNSDSNARTPIPEQLAVVNLI